MNRLAITIMLLSASLVANEAIGGNGPKGKPRFEDYSRTEINDWALSTPRAGLETVVLNGDFFLLGGRTPNPWVPPCPFPPNPGARCGPIPGDSTLWGDVWRSGDRGESWEMVLGTDDDNHWQARAYHEVVVLDEQMYLIGGQNFPLIDNPD
jgi:hypothetical protein